MRILFLNTLPVWGGCERWVVQVGRLLKDRGHHATIASWPGSITEQRAKENDLDIFPYNLRADVAFWMIPKLVRYLKREKIDVFVGVQTRDVKIGALAAKMARVPLIFARSGLDVVKKKFYHKLAYTKYIDGITTNTHALKNVYMSYGFFKDDFIHPIHDGFEFTGDVADMSIRSELKLPDDCKVLAAVGRIAHQKGFDILIEVARKAKSEGKNWRFVVVGTGPLEQKLIALTRKLDVEDYIKFIGFRKDVLPIMKASDLFVLSSRSESMTNVLREAMSVHTACVTTDVMGIRGELVDHKVHGYIVEPENVDALYDGIEYVLTHPELKEKMEKDGYERVKSSFSIEGMIDQIEQLFQGQLKLKGYEIT
jgi:glycosyltransferase involved in cell wall biosynthesis